MVKVGKRYQRLTESVKEMRRALRRRKVTHIERTAVHNKRGGAGKRESGLGVEPGNYD